MAAPSQLHSRHEPSNLPPIDDERWELVQRVVHSAALGRSEQLTRLLLYVCRMAITHRGSELNEQKIGVDLFGRAPNYDPGVDGIVRSHATRLRHRLKSYFETEGKAEPLVIEIPRGAYVPHFVPRESAVVEQPSPPVVSEPPQVEPPAVETGRRALGWRQWIVPFLILMVVTVSADFCFHLLWNGGLPKNTGSEQSRIERNFWNTLFPADGRTLLVPGDSALVLYSWATRQNFSLPDYINGKYRDPKLVQDLHLQMQPEFLLDVASRRYTSMVDLNLITQLSHLPQWTPERSETIFARDLNPSTAQNSNLILIGSRQANPWISLVEPRLNFYLVPDGDGGFKFLNRHPRPGESPFYGLGSENAERGVNVVYGQVAYLPNPGGRGMILVLGGLWMSGTQSAGNFVLNSPQFRTWLESIARRDGSIPPFELLLRAENLGGSAESYSILISRTDSQ